MQDEALSQSLAAANNVLSADARQTIIPVADSRVRDADPTEFRTVRAEMRTTNHQLTSSDRLGLYKQAGWHGLGEVIEEGLSGREATERYLGWAVDQEPVYTRIGGADGKERLLPLKANVRSDTKELLGVVGPDYVLVQNRDIGDFADALFSEAKAEGVNVRMETCGSLLAGRKVFLTMRPDREIRVGRTGEDVTVPLLCVSNAHDGTMAMTCFWTMVRVCCSNTLSLALSGAASDVTEGKAFKIRHKGKVQDYLQQAKLALGVAVKGLERYQEAMTRFSEVKLNRESLRDFFEAAYEAMNGKVPTEAKTEQDEIAILRRDNMIAEWTKFMGEDNQLIDGIAGTLYSAFNCITQFEDHVRTPKGVKTKDRQNHLKVLGASAVSKRKAMRVAMSAAK